MHNGSDLSSSRERMLALLRAHVSDTRVIDAMAAVPRECFVPAQFRADAYADRALPIGEGQTISQPLVVGIMLAALRLCPEDRVLEVGSGSGYAAAVMSRLVREVVAVERVPGLLEQAQTHIAQLGYANVRLHLAGAHLGREEDAPYDAILVSAGAPHIPRRLLDQLAGGGRMVVPVGELRNQQLIRATKTAHGVDLARLGPCAFVPLIGEGAWGIVRA